MKIGGIQKSSFLDYPGKMACVIFTIGCNMRCPFCHNKDLITGENVNLIPEKEIWEFLEKRKNILEGVVISGGEPTIQSDLLEFCQKIKKLGYCIKLDTNGTNPEILNKLLDQKLLDFVAMDIKNDFDYYDKTTGVKNNLSKIKESIAIIKENGIDYQFRSTIVRTIHNKEKVKKMLKNFPDLLLQKFRPLNCLDSKFLKVEPWSEEEWNEFLE